MTILEKMAKALETRARKCGAFNYIKASYLTIDGKEPHPRAEAFALADIRDAARAARDALVEGLTDEQCLCAVQLAFMAGVGSSDAASANALRAALIEATEVDDNDET